MPRPVIPQRHRLLSAVDALDRLEPEIEDPITQRRFDAALDAVAHALVDIAEGRTAPTRSLEWPSRPRRASVPVPAPAPAPALGPGPERRTDTGVPIPTSAGWRASWSAAGARLGPVIEALAEHLDGLGNQETQAQAFAVTTHRAAEQVRAALQAGTQRSDPGAAADWEDLRSLERALRRAHRALQPDTPSLGA